MTAILQPRQKEKNLSKTWLPYVRFQIPFEGLSPEQYIEWLTGVFKLFIRSLSNDQINGLRADHFSFRKAGEKGSLDVLLIDQACFYGCDLTAYDGSAGSEHAEWRGFVIDTEPCYPSQVDPIYLLAEMFELFMYRRHGTLVYERYGLRTETGLEINQKMAW